MFWRDLWYTIRVLLLLALILFSIGLFSQPTAQMSREYFDTAMEINFPTDTAYIYGTERWQMAYAVEMGFDVDSLLVHDWNEIMDDYSLAIHYIYRAKIPYRTDVSILTGKGFRRYKCQD